MKKPLTALPSLGLVEPLHEPEPVTGTQDGETVIRLEVGVDQSTTPHSVYLRIGEYNVPLSAESAHRLATELRAYASQVENGGRPAQW